MNPIKFAMLVSFMTQDRGQMGNGQLPESDVQYIADLVAACNAPQPIANNWSEAQLLVHINDMLKCIANGKKIEAIKIHRMLTGSPLKESKDTIEIVTNEMGSQWNNGYKAGCKEIPLR